MGDVMQSKNCEKEGKQHDWIYYGNKIKAKWGASDHRRCTVCKMDFELVWMEITNTHKE